jgi:hypothetical protein
VIANSENKNNLQKEDHLGPTLKFGRISRRPEEPKTRNSSCGIILRGIKNKVFRFQ